MICPKCGRTVPDGVPCSCGAPLLSSNPAVNLIKTLGSSPKFLAAAILYSASVALAIFASLGGGDVIATMYYYVANYGLDPEVFHPLLGALEGGAALWMVLGFLPTILVALGMWMFFGTCRSRASGNISTAGLTIIKVISIIQLVLLAICCLVLLALVVFLMSNVAVLGAELAGNGYIEPSAATVIAGVAVGVMALALIFVILTLAMEICTIRVINRVKLSAVHGLADNRVSRLLGVLLMILGVLGVLGGVIGLFGNPLQGLGSLCGSVTCILISLLLGEYRRKATVLLYPPVEPVYPGQGPSEG